MKTEIEVEKLLQWAYRDELSKRQVSAAEGIWDRIEENMNHGGIDKGHGAAQRYAHFGLPDPDAERVERAVSALDDVVIDWAQSWDAIAGDLSGLITVNDVAPRQQHRAPKAGWGKSGDRALKGMFGESSQSPKAERSRDVIMVGGLRTNMLVTVHAINATRPSWWSEQPRPGRIEAARGVNAMIVGECKGKNLYTAGSYCPLKYDPSPLSILTARADYAAWHQGLVWLTESLRLEKFDVLPPAASATPWVHDDEVEPNIVPVIHNGRNSVAAWGTLPLAPTRGKMPAGAPRQRASEVRFPLKAGCE